MVAGGVAANATLRAALTAEAAKAGFAFAAPPLRLCTDNAVMVAWAAIERLRAKSNALEATSPIPKDFRNDSYWL